MYFVYAIGDRNDLENQNYSNCYIGVTNNPILRWKNHTKSGYTVGLAINTNNWNHIDNMRLLFRGTADECFVVESEMRPMPLMGLNEAAGGRGGYTSYTSERGKKIAQALSGKRKSEEHCKKISEAKLGSVGGANNPKAKTWTLIDPAGNVHRTRGNIQEYCKQLGLCWSALDKNLGMVVGEISPKFRDKGDPTLRVKRTNTIGWKLIKEN